MGLVDAKTVEPEPAPLAIDHEPTEPDDSALSQAAELAGYTRTTRTDFTTE